jgi:hypothetical protein
MRPPPPPEGPHDFAPTRRRSEEQESNLHECPASEAGGLPIGPSPVYRSWHLFHPRLMTLYTSRCLFVYQTRYTLPIESDLPEPESRGTERQTRLELVICTMASRRLDRLDHCRVMPPRVGQASGSGGVLRMFARRAQDSNPQSPQQAPLFSRQLPRQFGMLSKCSRFLEGGVLENRTQPRAFTLVLFSRQVDTPVSCAPVARTAGLEPATVGFGDQWSTD